MDQETVDSLLIAAASAEVCIAAVSTPNAELAINLMWMSPTSSELYWMLQAIVKADRYDLLELIRPLSMVDKWNPVAQRVLRNMAHHIPLSRFREFGTLPDVQIGSIGLAYGQLDKFMVHPHWVPRLIGDFMHRCDYHTYKAVCSKLGRPLVDEYWRAFSSLDVQLAMSEVNDCQPHITNGSLQHATRHGIDWAFARFPALTLETLLQLRRGDDYLRLALRGTKRVHVLAGAALFSDRPAAMRQLREIDSQFKHVDPQPTAPRPVFYGDELQLANGQYGVMFVGCKSCGYGAYINSVGPNHNRNVIESIKLRHACGGALTFKWASRKRESRLGRLEDIPFDT